MCLKMPYMSPLQVRVFFFFFKQNRKHSPSPANLHLDSSNSDLRKAARERSRATDCYCLGKGNPLSSGSVVSMGTALLAFAGPPGLVRCTERKTGWWWRESRKRKKLRILRVFRGNLSWMCNCSQLVSWAVWPQQLDHGKHLPGVTCIMSSLGLNTILEKHQYKAGRNW